MKKVYISGRMTGLPGFGFAAFDAARDQLKAQGYDVASPADMERAEHPWRDYSEYDGSSPPHGFNLEATAYRDLEAVRQCDIIYMLRGWEASKGARAEKALAEWLGKEVMYEAAHTSAFLDALEAATAMLDETKIPEPGVPMELIIDEKDEVVGFRPDATMKLSNPKSAFGDAKIPVHLWPATATIVGSLGLLDGALKYGRGNWKAVGVRASTYFDACNRHLNKWFEGEDNDPDSGLPHLSHALACLAIIVDADAAGKLEDDRNFQGGYVALIDKLTSHVVRLKELHKGKDPKHYIKGTEV